MRLLHYLCVCVHVSTSPNLKCRTSSRIFNKFDKYIVPLEDNPQIGCS